MPITHAESVGLLDGDTELLPGITAIVTAGHTRCHQSIKIESEGQIAFFLGDLIPTVSPSPASLHHGLRPVPDPDT